MAFAEVYKQARSVDKWVKHSYVDFLALPVILCALSLKDSPMGISFSLMQIKSRFTEVTFAIATMNDLCVRTNLLGGNFSSIDLRLIRVRIGFMEEVRNILM